MARFTTVWLGILAVILAFTGCDPLGGGSEDGHLGEHWGSNDDPSNFDPDLEYRFDELPLEGEADPNPWAGSYWPTYEDSINYKWDGASSLSPAAKYGEAFGIAGVEDAVSEDYGIDHNDSRTACTEDSQCDSDMGERCAMRDGETEGYCIPTWWGVCHGWTPAAILEPEPVNPVTYNGVTFKVNDIKALMTLLYTSTNVKFLSGRNNDNDAAGEIEYDPFDRPVDQDARDTNPGTFHVVAANFLGIKKTAFAEDRTYDYQVWNQPMRSFEVTSKEEVTWEQANALIGVTSTGGETVSFKETVAKDEWKHLDPVDVEAGSSVKVKMTGTGDADLYVRFGSQPESEKYDCRPYEGSSNETCDLTVPEGESQVFASVFGYAETSDVDVDITYGGEAASDYQFNHDAERFIHIKSIARYISESSPSTDGNLSGTIDSYTHSDNYEYVLELDGDGRIIGGEWVGASKRAHPDFLWLPLSQSGASMANGKIKYDQVKMLLDMSINGESEDEGDDDAGDDAGGANEVTVTESGTVTQGQWKHYGPYDVAAMADIEVVMTGSGDADLYVRKGAEPTTSDYDCRPYENGTDEQCLVEGPGAVYVSVNGYAASSDYELTIRYKPGEDDGNGGEDAGGEDEGGDDPAPTEMTADESGTVSAEEWMHFGPYNVAAGGELTVEMTGTNDADLYVRAGAQPTSSEYDCRPYESGSNESCEVAGPANVYVSVAGYEDDSDFQLHIVYSGVQ